MIIDVLWLNRGNGDSIARGLWDQTLIGDLFDGLIWRLPHGLEFRHVETDHIDHGDDGAVVVLQGRWHTSPDDYRWVNAELAKLPWCCLVVSSDEESLHDPWQIEHPALRRVVMTPKAGRAYPPGTRFIGEGWSPGTREMFAETPADHEWQGLEDFAFAGQVTHQRRQEMWDALIRCQDNGHSGQAYASPGFTQGLGRDDYFESLFFAKVAPCPAGPATPDSFRAYEALEAGCMPVVDGHSPNGPRGWWQMVYGPDFPIPIFDDWSHLPDALPELLERYPANANRAGSWWQSYKREMVMAMADDVFALAGPSTETPTLADLITVVMPTSPIPSHPNTTIIDQTIASVRARLPDCDIIIACDGVRTEQEDRRADYDEYVRKLVWKCNHVWSNVLPIVADEHRHQAGMTKMAMTKVATPLILFVEHDTPLVGEIDFDACARFIASGQANLVRFSHESEVLPSSEHLMLDRHATTMFEGTDEQAIRTANWSQRPHLASSRFYRHLLDTYFGDAARSMIEDCLHGVVDFAWREQGVAGWERFKLWLYAPMTSHDEGGIQRSEHLDGRGSDPMFESVFEYPDAGPGPEGAPRAMSHRVDES